MIRILLLNQFNVPWSKHLQPHPHQKFMNCPNGLYVDVCSTKDNQKSRALYEYKLSACVTKIGVTSKTNMCKPRDWISGFCCHWITDISLLCQKEDWMKLHADVGLESVMIRIQLMYLYEPQLVNVHDILLFQQVIGYNTQLFLNLRKDDILRE